MMRVLGPPFSPEETEAFIAAARSYVNRVKFRHMGRDPKTGMDCAGVPQCAAKAIGRPVWDIASYGRQAHKDGLREALVRNLGNPIPIADMRAGDIPLMKFDGDPKHVGILFDHPQGGFGLIHCYGTIKKVTEHRLDAMWRDMIVAVWRP